jgi:hypothetical protein
MRVPRGRLAAPLAIVAFTLSAAAARLARSEASRPSFAIELAGCEPPLETEVRRIVEVELRASLVAGSTTGEAAPRVLATCRGAEADLSFADAATVKHLERTVALAEAVPTARARLLALAVAELVTSWQETQSSPGQPQPEAGPMLRRASSSPGHASQISQPPVSVVQVAADTRAPGPSVMADAIGAARAFPGSELWLLGVGARALVTLSRPLVLTFEVNAAWGKTSRSTGQVTARTMGGGLGLGWGLPRTWAVILPWAGVRAEAGRLRGETSPSLTTTASETQSGPCLGPEIGVLVSFFPRAPVHATVAFSAGATLLGVRGEVTGDRNVDLLGPWTTLSIGVGFAKR